MALALSVSLTVGNTVGTLLHLVLCVGNADSQTAKESEEVKRS